MKKYLTLLIQLALVQGVIRMKRETEEQMYFQSRCDWIMFQKTPEINEAINNRDNELSFIYPCEHCRLTHVELGRMDEKKMSYTYDEKTDVFITNMTFVLKSYTVDCHCHLHATEEEISKALKTFETEHFNSSCNKVELAEAKPLDPAVARACFHPKELVSQLDDPMGKVAISGQHVQIRVQLQIIRRKWLYYKRAIKLVKPDAKTLSQYNEIFYDLLRKEVEAPEPPEITCRGEDGDQDLKYEAETCRCLQKTHFFDAFPHALANHIFTCGNDFSQLLPNYGSMYRHSCRANFDPFKP